MILVDTPIWSLALRRRTADLSPGQRTHVDEWERLVRSGDVVLIGPIRREVLSGVRDEAVWERLRDALRAFPDLPLTSATYERAAYFFNQCRAAGVAGTAIDLQICAAAAESGAAIYTTDADFERYASVLPLRLHRPEA